MNETPKKLEEKLEIIKKRLGFGVTFDLIIRELNIAGRQAALVFFDGFIKDIETVEIMKRLLNIPRGGLALNVTEHIIKDFLPYFEVETKDNLDEAIDELLSGPMLLLIDGIIPIFVIDVREYPVRSVEEPDLERVTRGSREGFVETAIFNMVMVRRRVRDVNLRFEAMKVGKRSKTDVFLGYIDDIADPHLVKEVKKRISTINRDALVMGGKNLTEYLVEKSFNPLPLTRYTERPDVVAAHLYEGHLAIFVDTTPFVLLIPVTAWHFTQHAEEYFQNPPVGTYLRWVRTFGIFLSLFLIPLWFAIVHTENLPQWLEFIGPKEVGKVPLWVQFLLLEIGLDMIRMALIHTPNALATSLGIVGAILLGDLAVNVGIFAPEPILYIAVVAIGTFGTPSLEFAHAIRIFRYLIFFGTVIFGWIGLGVTTLIVVLIFGLTNSFGVPYLWPLIPFDFPALLRIIFRYPIPSISVRPRMTDPKDQRAQKKKQ
ncbi:MAG: spore germination protein [Firmicutes bacterium]|nr:spore germination protein [Bacillota bacterium]